MELRVLRYFLMVAKEQSFTKAAEQLNITQPTLSRQLAALEDELGAKLFNRGGHSITLTNEGLLLKRQALEIVDLEEKIISEFKGNTESVEGKITIGCGEFLAVEVLAQICKKYKEKYPLVQFGIHTGTADNISEMMNKGLVDIGLFLEPISTEGRSNIVGKPMSLLMLRENATVTICHSRTKNIKEICREADILIVAIGKPQFIGADYVKDGAVVIDVGIHRDENNKLCGDVKYDEVEPKASYITPVPGGVGPMTIAMLMHNCVEAMKLYS